MSAKHPDQVIGWPGNLSELAHAIAVMRYDTFGQLIELLATELQQQADADAGRGYLQLSARLNQTALDLITVRQDLQAAWKISKRHMRGTQDS